MGVSIGVVLTRDTNSARDGPPAITQTSIAGATLGHMQSYYKKRFGGWQARMLPKPGFPVLAFQSPEVAVYFPVEGQAAHIMTTWNRDYRTAAGIGPCSTVEEMKEAYEDAVQPSWSGTSPDGKKVFQWVVGDNLVFATFLDRKVIRAVALYEGNPNDTLGGSPRAYAGYVAAEETSCHRG